MLRRFPPSAAVLILLSLAGLLGCGQAGFCPDCAKSTQVTAINYPANVTLGQGSGAAAQLPNPTGGTPTTYAVVSGALPPGMALDASTGALTGTPTAPGVYTLTIQASNTAGATSQVVSFTVLPASPLALAYPTPMVFPAGTPIDLQPPDISFATPGIPVTYSITASTAVTTATRTSARLAFSLPTGLVLNGDGSITGTPTVAGVYDFTITATNGTRSASTSLHYTVTPTSALGLGYTLPVSVTTGSALAAQVPALANATPGVPTTFAVTSGTLPGGLALNADGSITGTPSTAGVFTFTVTATNGTETSAAVLSLTVSPSAPLTLDYTAPQTLTAGNPISALLPTLSNAVPGLAVTYTVSSGTLPAGLSLNPDGTVTGTPTTPGTCTFTITASNGVQSASGPVTIDVLPTGTMTLNYTVAATYPQGSAIAALVPALTNTLPGASTTFAVTAGTLPSGLVLNPDGTITGTPDTPGVYTFTITSASGTLSAQAAMTTTVVSSTPLALSYPAAGPFTQGAAIALQAPVLANATPGVATTYAVTGGTLPAGLVLNADGTITGTPTASGVFAFTVTSTNGTQSAAAPVSYTVYGSVPLGVAYASPAAFPQNAAITAQMAMVTGATPGLATTFAVTAGSLPAGLVLNPDGSITGTPTAAGVFSFTVTATNGIRSAQGAATYTVVPSGSLTLAYASPATFTQGAAIGTQNPTLGNATPGVATTYAVTTGSLPAGLVLNPDGSITGTPTAAGVFSFTVTATNGIRSAQGAATYTVVPSGGLTLAYASPATFTQGAAIGTQNPTLGNATPGVATTFAVTTGSLPAGLVLGAGGSITGTPTAAGVFPFTVTATNGARTAQASVSYTVEASAALTLSYPTPVTFTQGTAIATQNPTLGNATPGLTTTYTRTSGALPSGLTLNADGTVTGTPLAAGSFSWTLRATNGTRNASASVACTVNAAAPSALNYQTPVTYTAGYAIATNSANASGGPPSSYAVISGTLPAGLTLNTATGDITGTPTTAVANATVTIQGANTTGNASQTLTITVLGQPTASLTANPSTVPVGQASSLTILFTNGTGVLSGGNLASPVAVNDGASITTGVVASPTTYSYTLTVTSPQNHVVTSTVQVQWVAAPANSWGPTSLAETGGTYAPPSGNPLQGAVSLTVPDQQCATCGAVNLTVYTEASLPGALPSPANAYSNVYNLNTDVGYPFRVPVTVTLAYDPAFAGSTALTANDLPMAFFWDPSFNEWIPAGLKALDATNHLVTFTTVMPGRYVVLAIPGLSSSLASAASGFACGTDDWQLANSDIYDLPNAASAGMSAFASWFFGSAKSVQGTGLYPLFPGAANATAAGLASRLANGTLTSWNAIWNQASYSLNDKQTGLALLTGLRLTGQPQIFLMGDGRPAVNTALATAVYAFNATTNQFSVMDPNYPDTGVTITWNPAVTTGGFTGYSKAAGYTGLADFAFEGHTTVHRLSDYEAVLDGARSGFPGSTYATITVTSVGGVSNPDLSGTVTVPSSTNVNVAGYVTNGDTTMTTIFWSQNLDAPRTPVTLNADGSFSFTIPSLSNAYGTAVMLETSANPCDPTFSHTGFASFNVAASGLSPWFPDACFEGLTETRTAPFTVGTWTHQYYAHAPTSLPSYPVNSSGTFTGAWDANGEITAFTGTYAFAGGYYGNNNGHPVGGQLVASTGLDPHAHQLVDTGTAITPYLPMVLAGSQSYRINDDWNTSNQVATEGSPFYGLDTTSHRSAERIVQTIQVPAAAQVKAPKLSFWWAAVIQAGTGSHTPAQRPYVDIIVQDFGTGNTYQGNIYYHHFYVGDPTFSGWMPNNGTPSDTEWCSIPWQKMSLYVGGAYAGHYVRVVITASDCTGGAHAGYAYVDNLTCE